MTRGSPGARSRSGAGPSASARTIHEAATAKEAGLDALLAYDELRRGSLIEGFFEDDATPLDPVAPWALARAVVGGERLDCVVQAVADGAAVVLTRAPTPEAPFALGQRVTIRDATIEVGYRLQS